MIDFQNLDERTLERLGIAFYDSAEAKLFADYVLEELEVKIGEGISDGMSQALLDEFDSITNHAESVRWLNKNKPDYREIVEREQIKMVWNLLKHRKEVSTSYNRKEIELVHCHIQALTLNPYTYKCLCNAHLYFISDILDMDSLESVYGLDDTRKYEIRTKIVNYLLPKKSA